MNVKSQVMVQFFAGYQISPEFKFLLSKSFAWKQARILPFNLETQVIEVSHQGKSYLGSYLKNEQGPLVSLSQIRESKVFIDKKIREYCPNFLIDSHVLSIFPQVFIA